MTQHTDPADCNMVRDSLDQYIDGELARDVSDAVSAHLAQCAECSGAYSTHLEFVTGLRQQLTIEPAPDVLRSRVRTALRREAEAAPRLASTGAAPARGRGRWMSAAARWTPIAASLLLITGAAFWLATQPRRTEQALVSEVAASHVHSLMLDHLVDVKSTDQHTVKPWFAGKLPFAPIVPRLEEQGFPLTGGRIDALGARQVAVIVYQRRLHVINLYAWPETNAASQNRSEATRDGYHLIGWERNGVAYWAVSDVSWPDLRQFASLIDQEVIAER